MKSVNIGVRLSKDLFPYDFPRETLSIRDQEIVKITFRVPVYLRDRVKDVVKKQRVFKTENEFFATSAWTYLIGLDLSKELGLKIERVIPEVLRETMRELQEQTKRLVETQRSLLDGLDKKVVPVLEGSKQIREGIVDELKQTRENLKLHVLYLVSQLQPVRYEILREHALKEVSAPNWLFDDALALLVQEQFIKIEEGETYTLMPFGLRDVEK